MPWRRRAAWRAALALLACGAAHAAEDSMAWAERQAAAHPGRSGVYVLDRGEQALIARAWLADHARRSIEVQYFIWSTDNIGILAAEALLRAADRGVSVRVIVDDLLIDAPDRSLLALARHPRIDIRVYNPKITAGVSLLGRLRNLVTDLRGVNQRMHDKTFVVDGSFAITGGRNMAAEYFDYNHEYNFRDRDVLLAGAVVADVGASFERFWRSPLSAAVEEAYAGAAPLTPEEVESVYGELHAYARSPDNFAPEVRQAIDGAPAQFGQIAADAVWGDIEFISDPPGKNEGGFAGGGRSSAALGRLLESAQQDVLIQSPYLVASARARERFAALRARGVRIRISTNSLLSTDNLQAFSGYRGQREALLGLGIEVFEARPDAPVRRQLMRRAGPPLAREPVFSIHAKTLVVDGRVAYVGTFNLDPRSENLNTEVGVIIRDAAVAGAIAQGIVTDMADANSWNAREDPDRHAPRGKRLKAAFWQLLPLEPLL